MLFRNTAFQLFGRGTSLLAGLVAVPVYLHYLGAEAYGVVGVFISLMSLSGLFDLGLPIAINRQISVMRGEGKNTLEISSVIRSFELIFVGLCTVIFAVIFAGSGFIATQWLNLVNLTPETVTSALQLAGMAVVLRFPTAFYNNALFAFDCHARANVVASAGAIARIGFSILAFELFGISLEVFFWSQIVINGLELLILAFILWSSGLHFFAPIAKVAQLGGSLQMTIPLSGISVSALLLSQLDKVILSKAVALDVFGLYSVAYGLAMGLLPIAYSVGNASFPQISRLLSANQLVEMQAIVRRAVALLSIGVIPLSGVLIFFTGQIMPFLHLFTPKAFDVLTYLPFLAFGALCQTFTVLFHGYKVAQGKPTSLFYINLAALVVFSGVFLYAVYSWSVMGACIAFVGLNIFIAGAQTILVWFDENSFYWRANIVKLYCNVLILLAWFYMCSMLLPVGATLLENALILLGPLLMAVAFQMWLYKKGINANVGG